MANDAPQGRFAFLLPCPAVSHPPVLCRHPGCLAYLLGFPVVRCHREPRYGFVRSTHLRQQNPGATNVLRSGSKAAAAVTPLLDAVKGLAACGAGVVVRQALRAGGGHGRWWGWRLSWATCGRCSSASWAAKGVATALGVLLGFSAMAWRRGWCGCSWPVVFYSSLAFAGGGGVAVIYLLGGGTHGWITNMAAMAALGWRHGGLLASTCWPGAGAANIHARRHPRTPEGGCRVGEWLRPGGKAANGPPAGHRPGATSAAPGTVTWRCAAGQRTGPGAPWCGGSAPPSRRSAPGPPACACFHGGLVQPGFDCQLPGPGIDDAGHQRKVVVGSPRNCAARYRNLAIVEAHERCLVGFGPTARTRVRPTSSRTSALARRWRTESGGAASRRDLRRLIMAA